jgi:UDP-N-acetylmuramate--alanine ligase
MPIDITKIKKVHFIGIGGIGISAIARMMLEEGKIVSGSDSTASPITEELAKLGATFYEGQSAFNITGDVDLVVYTVAVPDNNFELVAARDKNISTLSYPEMLGLVSAGKFTIAIAGTHGKTTTTAMTAEVFIDAKKDPTVVVGSLLKQSHSNFISGKSEYFIVEACEYKRSFLHLSPKILAITNIDDDHLDYYGNLEGVQKAFREMCERVPADGAVVTDVSHPNIAPILKGLVCKVIDYKLEDVSSLKLKVPGSHNKSNAQVALAIAREVGINTEDATKALENFPGTWRRFEYKGTTATGVLVYDDYGHHPTEIKATLQGARELFKDKNITVIFQPHLYSRTKEHLDDFATAFADADNVLFAPIYAAREPFDPSVSSELLAERTQGVKGVVKAFPDFDSIVNYLKENTKSGDVVMTMGAGDVYQIGEKFLLG